MMVTLLIATPCDNSIYCKMTLNDGGEKQYDAASDELPSSSTN